MILMRPAGFFLASAALLSLALSARADESFARVAEEVNQKMVKVFGSGGFQGVPHHGSGVLISADGYVLTANSVMLDTPELRVHLADGRRFHAKVVATEPQLDVALLKIEKVDGLAYFDLAEAAKRPVAPVGTGVLAFSNQFEIATREEPMSVEHGVIAAYGKLHGRRGIFEAPYKGDVYVLDAITNNPGAAGGALTTRKGELLGLIGKELRNTLTDAWINYAVPVQAVTEGKRGDQNVKVSLADFVENARAGKYVSLLEKKKYEGPAGYHGLVLVPNVVERTPPYVDAVLPNSPAARAGFRPDDLVVYIEGEQVGSIKTFHEIVDRSPPGTAYKVEVRRGDRLMTLELKLEEPPGRKP
jgi:serine protease Do